MLCIAINSVSLAAYNYEDKSDETLRNQVIQIMSYVFTVIFLIEAILKIIGLGFFRHKNSYLRDFWNVLDFLIALSG